MKNKQIINPIGLKGKEIHERQLALMGIKPINENENKSNHAVELTKIGPDGNAYAVVRENHEYYIKISAKTKDLVLEDFKYIGGLQNKKSEAYPSYAKAIKQLNLKFKSLSEAYNRGGDINVFEDDNLLSEHHPLKADMKLSATKGIGDSQEYVVNKKGKELSYDAKEGKEEDGFGDNVAKKDVEDEFEKVKVNESFGFGFTCEGNLEENKPMMEAKNKNNPWAICRGKQNEVGKDKMSDAEVESCVLKKKQEFKMDESITESAWMEECGSGYMEEVELNEFEKAIEEMMARHNEVEEPVDYTMGSKDPNQLPNPPKEIIIPEDSDESSEVDNIKSAIESVVGGAVEKIGEDPNGNPIYGSTHDINLQYYVGPNNSIVKKDKTTGQESVMGHLDEELHGGQHRLDIDGDGVIRADDLKKVRAGALDELYYEESIEEAIKRLDALLEGEVKKKALK